MTEAFKFRSEDTLGPSLDHRPKEIQIATLCI